MNTSKVPTDFDTSILEKIAPELILWQSGEVEELDRLAAYRLQGGPYPPLAAVGPKRIISLSEKDHRPDPSLWRAVKAEFRELICDGKSEKYAPIREKLEKISAKQTNSAVVLIASTLGDVLGVAATVLVGFVAILLYALVDVGRNVLCEKLNS